MGPGTPDGGIAVGVDGSRESRAALGFAFAEADLRGRSLAVVHAWSRPGPHRPGAVLPIDFDAMSVRSGAERMMAELSAGWCEKYPGLRVRACSCTAPARGAEAVREGEIVEVHAVGGDPPYVVRWLDPGTAGVLYPGPDARSGTSEEPSPTPRRPVPG